MRGRQREEREGILPAPPEAGAERERPCPYCSARVQGHWLFCPFCERPLRYRDSRLGGAEGEIRRGFTLWNVGWIFFVWLGGAWVISAVTDRIDAERHHRIVTAAVTSAVFLTVLATDLFILPRLRCGSPLQIALRIIGVVLWLAGVLSIFMGCLLYGILLEIFRLPL
jgi:hypothetical protein